MNNLPILEGIYYITTIIVSFISFRSLFRIFTTSDQYETIFVNNTHKIWIKRGYFIKIFIRLTISYSYIFYGFCLFGNTILKIFNFILYFSILMCCEYFFVLLFKENFIIQIYTNFLLQKQINKESFVFILSIFFTILSKYDRLNY